MIKLTAEREITPYKWVHPGEMTVQPATRLAKVPLTYTAGSPALNLVGCDQQGR